MSIPSADYLPALCTVLRLLDPAGLGRIAQQVKRERATLWVCGNGGSYATALHWAADLTKHGGIRCQALGANPALLTALANDNGYHNVFADELLVHARPGDALVCLSVSGRSLNALTVTNTAKRLRLTTAAICGASRVATLLTMVDVALRVPSEDYGVVEDAMAAVGHWLVKELEQTCVPTTI